MNILHICTEDSGGAGLCCLRIHKALLQQGENSKVLALTKKSSDRNVYEYGHKRYMVWKALNKIIRYCGLEITDFNRAYNLSAKTGGCYTIPRSVIDLSVHDLVKQADIIHLHWIDNLIDYPTFFKKVDKPIVWTLHDENLFYGIAHYSGEVFKDNCLEREYYELKLNSVRMIENLGIVFLSEMMFEKFGNHKMIEDRNKTIINNPVDYKIFHPIEKQKARKIFGLNNDAKVFVFVAVNIMDPRKGLHLLSKAIQELNIANAVILAVGNNLGKLKLPYVYSVGPIYESEKMSAAYSCADYFVMPSQQEAFAQTPLEAMSCGVPVIAFPVSGTKELINDDNGIVTEGFNVQDLKNGIIKATNRNYSQDLIRKDVIDRFSPLHIAKKYITFYRKILKEKI